MPVRTLIIPAWCWDAMQAHVSHLAPQESCGLLAGRGQEVTAIFLVANELASPVRFRMEAREQLRALEQIDAQGLDLLAIFHSHPSGPSTPSATDIAEAVYPVVNIIWTCAGGNWQARGFWIAADGFDEVPLYKV
ncbi:MAG: M67 family metallopeptidase [Anaerolineales bacterium]